MRVTILAAIAVALFALCPALIAQTPAVIYDPLTKLPETNHSDIDEQIIKTKLVPKAAGRWSEDTSCDGGNMNVVGAVNGSFTRAGAKQRVLVYELCQTGNGFANNGVAVIENGSIVAHFTEEGGWNLEVSRAADINKNGRDELIIETGGGMHQGYTGSSVSVLEIGESAVTRLGIFLVYTNECENHAANKYCDRSYKLTATPGTKPTFLSQKFTNRGTDEKPRWVAAGRPLAAKTLGDIQLKFEAVK